MLDFAVPGPLRLPVGRSGVAGAWSRGQRAYLPPGIALRRLFNSVGRLGVVYCRQCGGRVGRRGAPAQPPPATTTQAPAARLARLFFGSCQVPLHSLVYPITSSAVNYISHPAHGTRAARSPSDLPGMTGLPRPASGGALGLVLAVLAVLTCECPCEAAVVGRWTPQRKALRLRRCRGPACLSPPLARRRSRRASPSTTGTARTAPWRARTASPVMPRLLCTRFCWRSLSSGGCRRWCPRPAAHSRACSSSTGGEGLGAGGHC
jgi:hypothetical protein